MSKLIELFCCVMNYRGRHFCLPEKKSVRSKKDRLIFNYISKDKARQCNTILFLLSYFAKIVTGDEKWMYYQPNIKKNSFWALRVSYKLLKLCQSVTSLINARLIVYEKKSSVNVLLQTKIINRSYCCTIVLQTVNRKKKHLDTFRVFISSRLIIIPLLRSSI